jgi:response regulator RpfG family c-di-GMP phosphodiesterase
LLERLARRAGRFKLLTARSITRYMSQVDNPPRAAAVKPRVLCVDDEPMVLEGLRDTLRRSFDVRTASSGIEGLDLLKREPEAYAVVVSDMRMPVMDGAAFLREARRWAPDATRMLLTGFADIEAAVSAVNNAQLFRFLTKPCGAKDLVGACTAALVQHRLITAERVLLEQTLHGSVKALADVLALANPVAFGRAVSIQASVKALASAAGMKETWEVEVAAMLAPIGAVTLPASTAEKLYAGAPLSEDEVAMVERVPAITRGILENIPRLEGIVQILDNYARPFNGGQGPGVIPIGARMLRIARDHDGLVARGLDRAVALATMRSREGIYDSHLLQTFAELAGASADMRVREITLGELRAGMKLADDVRSAAGQLLIAHGNEASQGLLERLSNLADGFVREPLRIFEPVLAP